MKDVVHHLKHIQKKVIQFARKTDGANTNEEPQTRNSEQIYKRRRHVFNRLPQVARFQ